MLLEALQYVSTSCPAPYRTMGYLKELIALEARYRRCGAAWAPHLERTKDVVVDAIRTAPRRRRAVVLGSGILADIPIKRLSEAFETVLLVDICFLRSTQRRIRDFGNVSLVSADITGIARPLYEWASGQSDEPLPLSAFPKDVITSDADLVVSANVVSQLPLLPVDFVRRRAPSVSEDALVRLAQQIVRTHLAYLSSISGSVCLITEIERRILARSQNTVIEDPLYGAASGIDAGSWTWDVAPEGELASGQCIQNIVAGTTWINPKD